MARGFNLNISVRGEVEAAESIEAIGKRALHPEAAFAEIEHMLLESERKLWERFPKGKLVRTGTLKRSLTEGEAGTITEQRLFKTVTRSGSLVEGAVREIYPERMRFGTSVYYSVFHQHGGRGVKGNVLVFRPADRKKAREIIADYLVGED